MFVVEFNENLSVSWSLSGSTTQFDRLDNSQTIATSDFSCSSDSSSRSSHQQIVSTNDSVSA